MESGASAADPDLRVIERSIEAWNRGDLEGFLDCLTDDVYWDDPPMLSPALDKSAVRRWAVTAMAAFPDMRFTTRNIYRGPKHSFAVHWTAEATMLGFFEPPGFAPTGRHVQFDGMDVVQVCDGKICRIQTFFDGMKLSMQAGFMPPRPAPGSAAEKLAVFIQKIVARFQRK